MARKKADSYFLTEEEFNKLEALLIAKRGEKFFTFVSEIMGTAYGTIRSKFLSKKVEKAIRDNVERYFENVELKLENKDLRAKLQRVNDLSGEK
jgi:cell shape-determining protein MreC